MIEIEIRAKIQDFEPVKKQLKNLEAEFLKRESQVDHIFGRDKDLDDEHKIIEGRFVARIREKGDKRWLEFKEIKRTGAGLEFSSPLASIESGFNFLEKLDFKKAFTVSKLRELYKYQDFEICLDNVDTLGLFLEIEHSNREDNDESEVLKKCRDLLKIIDPEAVLEPKKYGDLIQEAINKNK